MSKLRVTKIDRGWYFLPEHNLHVVEACNYDNPTGPERFYALDWVAVAGEVLAREIHCNTSPGKRISLCDVEYVHSTKRGLLGELQREADRGALPCFTP